jgi:hypothetical protein
MLNDRLLQNLVLAGMLLLAPLLHAGPLPDFEASYELKRGKLRIGTSSIALSTTAEGRYLYESRSTPTRLVSWFLKDRLHETSRGTLNAAGVRPDEYHYQRSGGRQERRADLVFDWQGMTVENHVEDSDWKMEIPSGTLDKLVSQVAMMLALQQGKTDVAFNIADGGKLKEYRFRQVGRETLELPAGIFETVKITKLRKNRKRETYIWCAPALNYLPVRIWQREKDGSEYQSDLESFSASLQTGK